MRDLSVIYYNTNGDLVRGFNFSPVSVTGNDLLFERVTKLLLTGIKSHAYSPDIGSTLVEVIKGNYVKGQEEQIATLINLAFQQVQTQIISDQEGDPNLDASEKLEKIELADVEYEPNTSSWKIKAYVYTQDNSRSILRI